MSTGGDERVDLIGRPTPIGSTGSCRDGDPAAQLVDQMVPGNVDVALRLAATWGDRIPLPGGGLTRERWQVLAAVAAIDLTTARVLEAHLDALAILAEAGVAAAAPGSTWGVFAAEPPGDARGDELTATGDDATGWTLTGHKPWCSLADRLSDALITAAVPGGRRLFAVSLHHQRVRVVPGAWHARGLCDVTSGPLRMDGVPARPVGDLGWYLTRPGFALGGIGVAACWYGGAVGVARAMLRAARRRPPDQIAAWHLGQVDLDVSVARACLREAAAAVDGGQAQGDPGALMALRVRSVVAGVAERVLARSGHSLGPAPLSLDEDHARRVADLTLYLRQHHAERDVARLGEAVAEGTGMPW